MTYHPLSDKQRTVLLKLITWWKHELIKQGKDPDADKRMEWMMNIFVKRKYNDNAKQFLNQMREMRLGIKETKQKPKSKPFRSTVNVNGFPMV